MTSREERRKELDAMMDRLPESSYTRSTKAFGVERELDLDQVYTAVWALSGTNLNMTRWAGYPEVKQAIYRARDALHQAATDMMAVRNVAAEAADREAANQ